MFLSKLDYYRILQVCFLLKTIYKQFMKYTQYYIVLSEENELVSLLWLS